MISRTRCQWLSDARTSHSPRPLYGRPVLALDDPAARRCHWPVDRAAIPQHIKAEVWARDGGACRQCGMDATGGASLEFDHIIPVALGGATSVANPQVSVANLQVLCRRCNATKGSRI